MEPNPLAFNARDWSQHINRCDQCKIQELCSICSTQSGLEINAF
jgi:hypothetical protein